jgi:hypothetical protein
MINTNLNLVRSKITQYGVTKTEQSRGALLEMANTLVQLAQEEVRPKRASHRGPNGGTVWEKAVAGEPAHTRKGDLKGSIHFEYTQLGVANFSAIVGPAMKYARPLEIAGAFSPPNWHGATRQKGFPFMAPAFQKFRGVMPLILAKHFGGA